VNVKVVSKQVGERQARFKNRKALSGVTTIRRCLPTAKTATGHRMTVQKQP
jgi:hypothetical protein